VDPFSVGIGGAGAIVAAAGAIVQVVNFAVGTSGSVDATYGTAVSTLDDEHIKRLQARSGGQLKVVTLQRHRVPFTFYRKSVTKVHIDRLTFLPKVMNLVKFGTDQEAAEKELAQLLRKLDKSETRVQIPLLLECEVVGLEYRLRDAPQQEYHIRSATIRPWHDAAFPYSNFFQEKANLQFSAHGSLVEGTASSYVVFSWHFRSDGRRFRATGAEKQGDLRLTLSGNGQPQLAAAPAKSNINILDWQPAEILPVGAVLNLGAKPAKPDKDSKSTRSDKEEAAGTPVRDRTNGLVAAKVADFTDQAAGGRGLWNPDAGKALAALRRYVKDRYSVPISYAPAQLRVDMLFVRYSASQWVLFLGHHTGDLYDSSPLLRKLTGAGVYRSDAEVADLVRRVDTDLDREFKSFFADRIKPFAGTNDQRKAKAQTLLDDYFEHLDGLVGQLPGAGADRDRLMRNIVQASTSGIVEIARAFGADPELARHRVEGLGIDMMPLDERWKFAISQLIDQAEERTLDLSRNPFTEQNLRP
jgi:hypothetical protein